ATPAIHRLSLHDALPILPRHETGKAVASHRVVTEKPGVTANSDASLYLREKELEEARQTVENLTQLMHLGPQAFAEVSEEELERSEEHTSELQSRENLVC